MLSPKPRHCAFCDKELIRRANEGKHDFDKRRYCDPTCYHAHRRDGVLPKTCPECQNVFVIRPIQCPSIFALQVYCSRKCASIAWGKRLEGKPLSSLAYQKASQVNCGRKLTEEQKQLLSELAKKRPPFSPERCKAMSEARKGKSPSAKTRQAISEARKGMKLTETHKRNIGISQQKRYANPEERRKTKDAIFAHFNGPDGYYREPTSIERILAAALDKQSIRYETHAVIKDIGVPDFVFPDQKVIVQADGEYWHLLSKNVKRDKQQDKRYRSRGYTVIRFWGSEIKSDPDRCVDRIVKVLDELTPAMPSH